MRISIDKLSLTLPASIADCMTLINKNEKGIALIVENKKLLGTVSDGDIRRGFLNGLSIHDSVELIMNKHPILAPECMHRINQLELMKINLIRQLPIINKDGDLVGLEWDDVKTNISNNNLTAFIMAGGEGLRLRPLTENIPKPMIEICKKPLLEITIDQLKKVGFKKIIINVRYLSYKIIDYFKDGEAFDVQIFYIEEPKPLGTAGGLGLIPKEIMPDSAFLVLNGDLLTTLNYKAFLDFHIAANYDFTLCGRPYEHKIPFGYPKIEGDCVVDFQEKPIFTHLVNSGIYCLSPELINFVKKDTFLDMPDLIRETLKNNKRVGVFPLREKFHEIGRIESFKKAEEFYKNNMQ